ncbi:hypothetical protein FA15DRAFT_662277 [Coprinopsis marcescibilis]|uniref:Alpha/beta-hydrolase n=1 Tax=Coprinopsis marcescibilis TaxID=230819 RepID=A0A5C3LCG6_COPMA|nr:hypothetical protein FA15DRAFT_662277 [Coprinopsis marcescibilis]
MRACLYTFLFAVLFAVQSVQAFEFAHNDPTECGDFTVRWEGGSPPFRLLIIPPGGTLRNLSIPSTDYDGTAGSFTTPLLFEEGSPILFAMSDATGVTAGGITPALTVGEAEDDATCNTVDPGADFFYTLDSELQQCVDYPFTNFGGAVQPITVFGFVPGGPSFEVQPPTGTTTFNWLEALTEGTTIAFFMTDARGRNGGTSRLLTVGPSAETSCLAVASTQRPSSTLPPSASTPPRTSQSRPSSPPASSASNVTEGANKDGKDNAESTGSSKTGIIVGAAAGGFVLLGVLAFVVVFCFKRKNKQNAVNDDKFTPNSYGAANTNPTGKPTYLLPSAYSSSTTNLAPANVTAPYAQDTYASSQTGSATAPYAQNTYASSQTGNSIYAPPTEVASTYGGYQPSAHSAAPQSSPYPQSNHGNLPPAVSPYYQGDYGANGSQVALMAAGTAYAQPNDGGMYSGYGAQGAPSAQTPYGAYGGYNQTGYPQGAAAATGAAAGAAYGYGQQHQYAPQSTSSYGRQQGQLVARNADPAEAAYDPYAVQNTYPPPPPSQASTGSSSNEKRGPPPSAAPTRVIQHKDIEDNLEILDELPPQYSESRAPIPGLLSSAPLQDRKG